MKQHICYSRVFQTILFSISNTNRIVTLPSVLPRSPYSPKGHRYKYLSYGSNNLAKVTEQDVLAKFFTLSHLLSICRHNTHNALPLDYTADLHSLEVSPGS